MNKIFIKGQKIPEWLETIVAIDIKDKSNVEMVMTFWSTCAVWEFGESYHVYSLSEGVLFLPDLKIKNVTL